MSYYWQCILAPDRLTDSTDNGMRGPRLRAAFAVKQTKWVLGCHLSFRGPGARRSYKSLHTQRENERSATTLLRGTILYEPLLHHCSTLHNSSSSEDVKNPVVVTFARWHLRFITPFIWFIVQFRLLFVLYFRTSSSCMIVFA